jgi:hypothetical protein
VCGLPASASVPAAVDYAPEGAEGLVAVRNIGQLADKLMKTAEFLPPDMIGGLAQIRAVMAMPGVNPQGSLVLVPLQKGDDAGGDEGAGGNEQERFMVIVPVSDHKAFAAAAGADANTVVTEINTPDGGKVFTKALGDGYSAFSSRQDLVTSYTPARGNKARVEKQLGVVGNRVADSADILLLGDVARLGPKIKQKSAEMKMQGQFAMMMAGGGPGNGMFDMLDSVTETFVRDADIAVIGVNLGENGVSVDLAACFREGTEMAGKLSSAGDSSKLAARLPNQPYLFAMAADTSIPAVKMMVNDLAASLNAAPAGGGDKGGAEAEAAAFGAMKMLADAATKSDGVAFQMGFAPGGISTGLLASSVLYSHTKSASSQLDTFKQMLESVSGKNVEGTSFTSEWKPAADVNGAKVSGWAVGIELDPNSPDSFQQQQVQMMLYGSPPTTSGSPRGYAAATDSGLVVTMSQSSKLMGAALDAAKNGTGMGSDELTKSVSDQLPAGRTFEMYIGVKPILDTGAGVARMLGQQLKFELPEKLAPVGMGATTDHGGVQMRMYVPYDVIRAVRGVMQNLAPQGEQQGGEAPKSKGPRS